MTNPKPSSDPAELALAALGWLLSNDERAQRFLDLTGLTPDGLRDGIGKASTHRAVFDFLAAHEPDLIAAADGLGIAPDAFMRASHELGR